MACCGTGFGVPGETNSKMAVQYSTELVVDTRYRYGTYMTDVMVPLLFNDQAPLQHDPAAHAAANGLQP